MGGRLGDRGRLVFGEGLSRLCVFRTCTTDADSHARESFKMDEQIKKTLALADKLEADLANAAKTSASNVERLQPTPDLKADPDADERVMLTVEQVEAMLPDGERVHTLRQPFAGTFLGADWDRAEILAWCKRFQPEEAGPYATRMNHGIVLTDEHGPLFIETKTLESPPALLCKHGRQTHLCTDGNVELGSAEECYVCLTSALSGDRDGTT